MKKKVYISPSSKEALMETDVQILAGSPTETNIDGLGISDQEAPADMVGRSRHSVWGDEETTDEEF